jgi:serine protease Do
METVAHRNLVHRPTTIPTMRYRTGRALGPFRCSLVLGICFVVGSEATRSTDASELRRNATVQVVERARPSVVNIHGQKTLTPHDDGYNAGQTPQRVNGMGTGVVIDPRGYIITNHHVVDGVKKIEVTLADEKDYTATLISHDLKTDLAIIKIDCPDPMPIINIGTSSDLMPGEPVIAVGNAYGYEHTVTRGIISALHRRVQVSDAQSYNDLIQTDASINPGNSGGPLLNIDGEMVGINVAVRAGAQGIGFAIPVDMAMRVAAELLSIERIDHNWHGLEIVAGGEKVGKPFVIGKVDDDSPAAKCGLKSGDVIRKVGDTSVARALDVERALLGMKAGDEVPLVVERRGSDVKAMLTLAQSPRPRAKTTDPAWEAIGLKLAPTPDKQFQELQSRYRGGLTVLAVRPESPASRQGIRRGDVLVGMHVWETVSLENVSYILNRPDFATLDPVKFYILRGNETLYGHMTVALQK